MLSWDIRLNAPCGRMSCPPGWTRTRENSLLLADAELWFVWRGRGWMRTHDREFSLAPGFCAIMRPGGIYDAGQEEGAPLGIAYIHFDLFGKRRLPARHALSGWPEFFRFRDVSYLDSAMQRIMQLRGISCAAAQALMRGVLADILQRPSLSLEPGEPAALHGDRIWDLMASLRAQENPRFSVGALARQAGMSAGHFSRTFRLIAGMSPQDFLLELRLDRAQHLLRESDLPVGEIANRLQYRDVFFFSRQFKLKTGFTPSQYRKLQVLA